MLFRDSDHAVKAENLLLPSSQSTPAMSQLLPTRIYSAENHSSLRPGRPELFLRCHSLCKAGSPHCFSCQAKYRMHTRRHLRSACSLRLQQLSSKVITLMPLWNQPWRCARSSCNKRCTLVPPSLAGSRTKSVPLCSRSRDFVR